MADIIVENTSTAITVAPVETTVNITQVDVPITVTKTDANITVASNVTEVVVNANVSSPPPPVTWHTQITTLTATDIVNKYIHLDFLPDLQSISFFVQDGLAQTLNVTYTITGSTLLWAGYPLEPVLIVGDIFNIKYLI